jgi:CubicO group peptidase (beta-lactamase class C family)
VKRLLVVALFACSSTAKPPVPPKPDVPAAGTRGIDAANLRAQLPPYLESIGGGHEHRKLSGYVLVAQDDKPIVSQAFGFADRATRRRPTADTSFRIGSITKQFTAAAILRLEQDGKLSVTDTVGKHLPSYKGPAKDVTIHQLLTHTAGIPNYTADLGLLMRKHETFTVEQLLATFADKPLEFTPGSAFKYSNSGYAVLGAIIERASGKPYAQYVREALFEPAKLTRTVVGDAIGDPDRAEGYTISNKEVIPADPIDMSVPYAAGAIRSTANDLVRWHRALQGDTILNAASRAKLYKAERDNYAYGWVAQKVEGRDTVWHNGGIDGFHAMLWRIPDADLVAVVLSNTLEVSTDPIGKAAIVAALGGKLEPIKPQTPGTFDPAIAARITGTYQLTADAIAALDAIKAPKVLVDSITTLEISDAQGALVGKPNGQPPFELAPIADGTFYDEDHDIRLRVELPASGPAQRVILEQGKLALGYQRK